MTMQRNIRGVALLAICFLCFPALAEETRQEALRNKLLQEELKLAQAPASYVIFDLEKRVVSLKARGMSLREWKIESLRRWGNPAALEIISLHKKSALFAPKRKKIKPGANQSGDKFELDVLELKDMPSSFVLSMSGGLSIYVNSRPGNFLARMASLSRGVKWFSWLPLKNLWFQIRKKPFSCLDIRVGDAAEAKALYWALGEGFRGLVIPRI